MLQMCKWELQQSCARLARRPAAALLSLLVLSGGLGAFLFTVLMLQGIVNARPPFAQAERIVQLNYSRADNPRARVWIPMAEVRELIGQLSAFERIAAYTETTIAVRDDDVVERMEGALLGVQGLEVLGVAPQIGRGFSTADGSIAEPLTAILSDRLWRNRYQADPAVIGRQLFVDGRAATVIGVMPPDFSFPFVADLWIPAKLDDPMLASETFMLVGRLAEGATLAQAREQMGRHFDALSAERRGAGQASLVPAVTPLIEWLINPNTRYFIWLMVSCGAMVLLLAVSNGAYLLLAQLALRQNELATRAAIGASRARLVASVVVDALLICAVATAVALALARLGGVWLTRSLAEAGDPLPDWMNLGLSPSLVGWALLTMTTVAALVAVAAVWRVWRQFRNYQPRSSGMLGDGRERNRLAAALSAVQIALTCTLMLSAVVSVRMLIASAHVQTGTQVDPERVLGAQVALAVGLDAAAAVQRSEKIVQRLRAEPGVLSVSLHTRFPGTSGSSASVQIEGIDWGENATRSVARTGIDDQYLSTFGVPVLSGRSFSPEEISLGRPVALIDQQFARDLFAGADPLGRRILVNPNAAEAQWHTVIGVTGELHLSSNDDTPAADLLLPFAPTQNRFFGIALATSGDPSSLASTLPSIVAEIDRDVPVYAIRSYAQAQALGMADVLLITQILGGLAALGLLLAAAGLYGSLALTVSRRTAEIGLRRAVGANAMSVIRVVSSRSALAIGVGLLLGALVGGQVASSLAATAESEQSFDLALFAIVGAILLGVIALALSVPIRRALKIDPMRALRSD